MSILDTSRKPLPVQIWKTLRNYLFLTAAAILIDHIYALFAHGVRSPAMYLLFLYPLFGGALMYLLLGRFVPPVSRNKKYRLFYNVYNSGIAILAVGSLLKGILDIAGTASPYVRIFYMLGWSFISTGPVLALLVRFQP